MLITRKIFLETLQHVAHSRQPCQMSEQIHHNLVGKFAEKIRIKNTAAGDTMETQTLNVAFFN